MKKFLFIDQKDGDMDVEPFESENEAIKRADYIWNHLTESEKKSRECFEVGIGEIDEDGIFDGWDTIKSYK